MCERLVELMKQTICHRNLCKEHSCEYCNKIFLSEKDMNIIANHLIENGVVLLPCRVGDTIYSVRADTKKIYKCKVIRVSFYENSNEIKYFIGDSRFLTASFDDIGKSIFLTREEAKKYLKEEV